MTLRPLAGLLAGSALLLSGCGVADTGLHPGVAAEVGDETVSVEMVDELTTAYCAAITDQLEGQIVPMSYLRSGVVGQLTLAAAARQLAADFDVEPGAQYDQEVAGLRTAVATLPDDQQEAVIEIQSSAAYLAGVQQAVGEKVLGEAGAEAPADADPAAEGQRALVAWFDENGVDIDPQFGIAIEEGQQVVADTGISFAVSDAAKLGTAEAPDQEYAASLPAPLRCG